MKQTRLMCLGFGSEQIWKILINFFNERKKRRDYENINFTEAMRELKIFEFDIDADEKEEFIKWLGQHVWLHNHTELQPLIKMMLKSVTGYKQIKDFPISGNRGNNFRFPVYAVFEREFEPSKKSFEELYREEFERRKGIKDW